MPQFFFGWISWALFTSSMIDCQLMALHRTPVHPKKPPLEADFGPSFQGGSRTETVHKPANSPIKVIDGQHRFEAIRFALENSVDVLHGVKVYFALDMPQRLDVQLIRKPVPSASPGC